jgi:hypothetical protein
VGAGALVAAASDEVKEEEDREDGAMKEVGGVSGGEVKEEVKREEDADGAIGGAPCCDDKDGLCPE